jgi:hypothetical protein
VEEKIHLIEVEPHTLAGTGNRYVGHGYKESDPRTSITVALGDDLARAVGPG